MIKINKNIVAIMSISFILLVFLLGCSNNKQTEKTDSKPVISDIVELKPEAIKEAGISVLTVANKPLFSQTVTTGEVKTNEDKKYMINSLVAGRLIQDRISLGDFVKQGQTVAIVQNPEVTKIHAESIQQFHENDIAIRQAQTKYSLAKMNYEREKKLFDEGISPKKDYIQAQADLTLAKLDLKYIQQKAGYIKSEAKAMLGTYGVNPSLNSKSLVTSSPITALRSGVVTKKNVTVGAMVSPEQVLYEVSDLGQLWLDITVYSKDITKVSEGQEVIFKPDSLPGMKLVGKINYIQPSTDEPTQTFIVRAFIDNSKKLLKPGMYGQVTINNNTHQLKLFVPDEAIQNYGKEYFVFLDLGDGKYQKQVIQLGERTPEGHFVNSGVKPRDKIVGTGSFTLKAEYLKSEFAEEE